jgi:Flp pilus assembly protein TadD
MNPSRLKTAALLAALTSLAASPGAFAADTSPPPPAAQPAANPLAAAQSQLKAQRWAAALDELRRVNASADADWNNLMGYALRKQAKPDLEGAQRHYDAALRINPNHQGALEYAGELALMKRDPAAAEAYLARLQKLCTSPCEPLDDLKQAIAKYKSANKS